MIKRAFADVAHGQIHYRYAGEGAPLVLLHASPGSSRQLVPLIEALATQYRVIAPDTPGNGDSTPLPVPAPNIEDYARILPGFFDAIGLAQADVYGSHTGASIAADLAILAPDRVGKVILDGIGVFSSDERDDMLAHYAHPFVPDHDGAYLMRAYHFVRDQYMFFPWYARTRAARRDGGMPPASDFHAWFVEVLKASETYHFAYRAAFSWEAETRVPLVKQPALVLAALNDPLFDGTRDVTATLPNGRFTGLLRSDDPDFAQLRTAAISAFLNESN